MKIWMAYGDGGMRKLHKYEEKLNVFFL